jgi:catechol 2,3-dioxygenase-like lactoylglutathione lyase family enzyme
MKIEKIDHIGILVKDVKKAEKFFTDLFETQFAALGEVKDLDITSMMEPSGIEIVQPLSPDGVSARTLNNRGEGLTLLSLKVASLDEAMAEMKSRGVRLTGQVQSGRMRAAIYHPKDAYGVMIELIEYQTEHPAVTAGRP